MKISKIIENLEELKTKHGDIEVMINYSLDAEDGKNFFRTTVENFIFDTKYKTINKTEYNNHILLVL